MLATECFSFLMKLGDGRAEHICCGQLLPALCYFAFQCSWRHVSLMLRCSSLGNVENRDSCPPNAHRAHTDSRNNPEYLQSSLTCEAHDFEQLRWALLRTQFPLQPALVLVQGRLWKQSWALHSLHCLDRCFPMCASFQDFTSLSFAEL